MKNGMIKWKEKMEWKKDARSVVESFAAGFVGSFVGVLVGSVVEFAGSCPPSLSAACPANAAQKNPSLLPLFGACC